MRSQLDAINKIDMTPLIDLTFLLLIVFMVTMPLLEYGTSVETPQMNSDKLPEDVENVKSVAIDKNGGLIFEKEPLSRELLIEKLTVLRQLNPNAILLIRADGSRSYNEVMSLMKDIKNSGFNNVTLITGAED